MCFGMLSQTTPPFIYVCIYIYVYIYICIYINIYIYICICFFKLYVFLSISLCLYIYIYVYIYFYFFSQYNNVYCFESLTSIVVSFLFFYYRVFWTTMYPRRAYLFHASHNLLGFQGSLEAKQTMAGVKQIRPTRIHWRSKHTIQDLKLWCWRVTSNSKYCYAT